MFLAKLFVLVVFRSAKLTLMRKGEPIDVSAELNENTKFAKLKVGKNVVTTRQKKGSKDPLLPLTIALNDLNPLSKV